MGRCRAVGWLAVLMPCLTALPAGATPAGDEGIDCRTAVSTPDLTVCASDAYDAADERLNAAYRAVIAFIDKTDVPADARRASRVAQGARRGATALDRLPRRRVRTDRVRVVRRHRSLARDARVRARAHGGQDEGTEALRRPALRAKVVGGTAGRAATSTVAPLSGPARNAGV